jgi:hypothetical protein
MMVGRAAVVLRSELCENYGDLDDYLQEYEDGKLTAEAKAILEHGPLDTVRLRCEARMSADSAKSRFDRALVQKAAARGSLLPSEKPSYAGFSPWSCK